MQYDKNEGYLSPHAMPGTDTASANATDITSEAGASIGLHARYAMSSTDVS